MRYYIISEEDLKNFIRTSKLYGFACECSLYCPTEEELEVTEENLKRYKELKDYIEEPEEPSMDITDTNMNDWRIQLRIRKERMRHLNKDILYRLTSKVEGSIYRAEPFKITDVGELLALQEVLRLLNILLQNGQISIDEQ